MKEKYFPPEFNKQAFHCGICHVYAKQKWSSVVSGVTPDFRGGPGEVTNLVIALCSHCNNYSVWVGKEMLYPSYTTAPAANQDLSKEIIEDYDEAASISQKSPRGAAALLRLAIQKLCMQLGEKGRKIDDDIASLVKKGLPIQVQQALDIVRVIGNESVHPGTIDLRDDTETATQLFGLINLIAEIMITQPKHVATMYAALPAEKIKGIENRDKKP